MEKSQKLAWRWYLFEPKWTNHCINIVWISQFWTLFWCYERWRISIASIKWWWSLHNQLVCQWQAAACWEEQWLTQLLDESKTSKVFKRPHDHSTNNFQKWWNFVLSVQSPIWWANSPFCVTLKQRYKVDNKKIQYVRYYMCRKSQTWHLLYLIKSDWEIYFCINWKHQLTNLFMKESNRIYL